MIKALTEEKSFNLIEHLTGCIYEVTYQHLMDLKWENVTLEVCVNKVSPPVPGIHGGVSFSYSNGLVKS